jgi:pimeloyl-ACP methyl ester carboxylesterase
MVADTVPRVSTFVLVHGAMHGGWCWRSVARDLQADGHDVFTPTLSGMADRAHVLSPELGVADHVADLVGLIWFEDLTDVTLVLHSYAGVLAGPVVGAVPDRVASLVHLASFVARAGESLLDVEPAATARRYVELAEDGGDGWRIPASEAFLDQWGVTDPAQRAWIGPRLTDFPLRCATDAVMFDESVLASVPTTYVRHTAPPLPSLDGSWDRAGAAGWHRSELRCGHDVMVEDPSGTSAILRAAAQR